MWQKALRPLINATQHCIEYIDSPFGLALYSRLLLNHCAIYYADEERNYPYIRAELVNGLAAYGIHPPLPANETLAQQGYAILSILAQRVRQEKHNVIVLGDMNMTAFSPIFRDFIQTAGIHVTSPGIRPIWRPLLLSIDHALVRDSDKVKATGSDSWQGFDHKPIWISYFL